MASRPITRERAERIIRGLHCPRCLEYSFRKIVVKPAAPSVRKALKEVWHVQRSCGVCGLEEELGLDAEGDILYAG